MLEADSKILTQLEDINNLLVSIGSLVVDIQNKEEREFNRQQEMISQQFGIELLSTIFQNLEKLDKTLPVIEMLMKFWQSVQDGGKSQEKLDNQDENQ